MKISNLKTRLVSLALALCMIFSTATFKPAISHAEVAPANWVDDKETARYWPIPNQGRLVKVSTAETLKNPSLRYIGGYTRPDGREVVRLAFSGYSGATTDVWLRLILKPDNNLNQLIDWDKSGIGKKRTEQFPNNHDGYNFNKEFIKFEPLSASQGGSGNLRYVSIGEKGTQTVRTGLLGVNFETPIDLVLKKGETVKNLKENPLIQMRLMDSNFERIYSTTIAENEEVPYSSYTMSTFVPVRVDLKKGILNTDVARNTENTFQSASSYIKYNEEKGYVDVYTRRTQGAVGSTADSGGAFNAADKRNEGDYGFMQTFDKSFIDILKKQDESGTVAQIFAANSNDAVSYPSKDPTVPLPANRVDYSINDIEKIGDVGVVKVTNNTPDKTFMRTGTTLTGYGTSTVVRYFIDKNKLKESFGSSDIVSYEFFSTVFATNPTGIEEFKSVPRDEDIDLRRGDTIDIEFDGRRDFLTLGTFDTNGSVIQIGDDQYKFGIRTTGDKTKYAGQMRKMTVSVPFDIKIKKDTPLTIFSRKTKRMQVSPGMTVTFNYSALDDGGNKVTKQKTYRFERPLVDGYTRNEKGEIFKDGQKINDPQQSLFIDNHDPLMVSRQENFGGGILTRTVDVPDVNEIFTDNNYIAGRTKYDSAKVFIYKGEKTKESKTERIGELVASNEKKKMHVNGHDVEGFEWQSQLPKEGEEAPAINKDLWKTKDTPIYITNQDVLANALENENGVVEQVQAKVKFDLNGGKIDSEVKSFKGFDDTKLPGTEFAYKTERQSGNEEVVRIAPMNVKYNDNPEYKPNGFEGENVSLKDHNGKDLAGDALELRKFVAEEPTVEGKVFLGWTTQPLKGTPEAVTKAFSELKEADTADKVNSDQNYIFTKTSPITKETTVYAAYGSPMVKFHTNPPAKLTDKTDEVINQSLTEQNITDRAIDLQKNHKDPKFQMEGYSLIGYSVNKDAKIPDENLTGTGITADKYLRDGDKMPLTKDQVKNGLDLYAIWKPNYYVNVTKQWDPEELKAKNEDKIYVGLLTRPAVGVAGHEVVNDQALYRPVKGSVKPIKNAQNSTLSWTNLPSYDENGHRMSYITVELTEKTKQKFEAGITEYKEYGISVIEKEIEKDSGRFKIHAKTQLVNTDGVDAMSAATERKHYKSDGTSVDPHQVALGYFDTYGYDITLKNTEVKVQPPLIEDVEEGANKVVVKKVGDPNKLTITLPNGKKVILVKNGEGKLEKDPASKDFTGNVEITPEGVVTLTLPGEEKFKAEDVIQAFQTKKVGDADANSTIAKTVVKEQPTSHKVVSYEQKPNDDKGNAVVEFTVPRHPLLPPKQGSKYTIGYKDGDNFVPVAPEYVLDEDIISDNDTEKKATFKIPQENLKNIKGKKLIIKSDEEGKKPNYSDEVKVDTTAPKATAKAEDELWRRWVNLDLTGFIEESNVIVVSYTDAFGQEHKLRFDNEPDATGTVNMLERQGFKHYEVTLEDRFGNASKVKPNYKPTTMTQVSLRKPRVGRKFVEVKVTDRNTHVTVRVYNKQYREQVMNNIYYYDKIKSADIIANASVVAQAKLQPGRGFSRIKFEDFKLQNGDVYKLQKGDIIEVIGSTDTGANNRTNPLVYVIK